MDGAIQYLNTDLDDVSAEELTELVAAFESLGIPPLHVMKGDDGLWHGTFETTEQHEHVEPNVAAIVTAIESLPPALQATWNACTLRELNAGYDCGDEPWAFQQRVSNARGAATGASLRITLYPEPGEHGQPTHVRSRGVDPDGPTR